MPLTNNVKDLRWPHPSQGNFVSSESSVFFGLKPTSASSPNDAACLKRVMARKRPYNSCSASVRNSGTRDTRRTNSALRTSGYSSTLSTGGIQAPFQLSRNLWALGCKIALPLRCARMASMAAGRKLSIMPGSKRCESTEKRSLSFSANGTNMGKPSRSSSIGRAPRLTTDKRVSKPCTLLSKPGLGACKSERISSFDGTSLAGASSTRIPSSNGPSTAEMSSQISAAWS
mmetsp:Transcript_18805/g.54375  ORF Transcript_18805/g.54375 Transcript_18805/m.54375 type:complete len:230 (+) Transcript_18805:836-1525(+)